MNSNNPTAADGHVWSTDDDFQITSEQDSLTVTEIIVSDDTKGGRRFETDLRLFSQENPVDAAAAIMFNLLNRIKDGDPQPTIDLNTATVRHGSRVYECVPIEAKAIPIAEGVQCKDDYEVTCVRWAVFTGRVNDEAILRDWALPVVDGEDGCYYCKPIVIRRTDHKVLVKQEQGN